MRNLILALALIGGTATMTEAQQTPQAQAPQTQQGQPEQPQLPKELQLERDNLILQVRINELEAQLAAVKAQLVNDRINAAAPALIQKLSAAAPDWDVDPQTLTFKKKQSANGAVPPANGTGVPASPTPQQ